MELVFLAIALGIFAIWIWLSVRVLGKAGRSGWWCLLMIVPLVQIVPIWIFAFARWPALEVAAAAAPSPTGPSVGAAESGGRGGQASAATPSRPESKGPTTPGI